MKHGETVYRYLDCQITEDQSNEYGKEQAKLLMEVKGFEADRKVINDQIKPRKDRVDKLAQIIDTGIEHMEVECVWEYDWDNMIKCIRRTDTDEIVGSTMKIEEGEQEALPGL